MSEPRDLLREWAAAERLAILAEEMVRAALNNHMTHGLGAPSSEMQENAAKLRDKADSLFQLVRVERGVSGS